MVKDDGLGIESDQIESFCRQNDGRLVRRDDRIDCSFDNGHIEFYSDHLIVERDNRLVGGGQVESIDVSEGIMELSAPDAPDGIVEVSATVDFYER